MERVFPTGKKEEYHEVRVGVVSEIISSRNSDIFRDAPEPLLGNHSYTVCLGNADNFFKEFLIDCAIRDVYRTKQLVLMEDEASWIWNKYNDYFGELEPDIKVWEILDFWHY